VQAVLAARIDLLEEAEKTALQAAAVIGRVFWTGPVYELIDGLAPDLHLLETRDFIRKRPVSSLAGEVEYAFKHALTREVAYGTLTKTRRAQLHTQFADWLERLGEGRDEHAPLLAHHYAEAVRPEDVDVAWPDGGPELERARAKAVSWLERAAEAAMSRYELEDAADLLHRALALVSERREKAMLWLRIGRAHAFRYDGDGFMESMQNALELTDDPVERAEAYAELAFHSATRSGMWRHRPERDVMEDWTSRALAGVQQGGAGHVKALLARVYFGLPDADESTLLATELADQLGDIDLRSSAFDGRGWTAFRHGDFAAAHEWEMRRFDFMDQLTDPDLKHDLYLSAIPPAMALGRTDEARRLAAENDELVQGLTPHHRLHGVACKLEIEELVGNWDTISALEHRTEEAVAANRDTPCIRNARSLLLCALASELLGYHDRSVELEAHAAELQSEGYGATLATPRARLALARGEVDQLHELLRDEHWLKWQTWFTLPAGAARLDVLAVVGAPAEVEAAAGQIGTPRSYLEPFALRSLGVVRADETLLAQADERFRGLGLDWHADQTDVLIRFRNAAAG
jgi:tetratricopeptide (TPR) repeat protein